MERSQLHRLRKLVKASGDKKNLHILLNERDEPCDGTEYRFIIGKLLFAANTIRLDINFIVSKLSRCLKDPLNKHLDAAAKRVLRYLKGTTTFGLIYVPQLIVYKLPLLDPGKMQETPLSQLAKCSAYHGNAHGAMKLPQKLYGIIINFPEPLQATTWDRCCYESYTMAIKKESESKMAAGESTQMSLWKSYENQFEHKMTPIQFSIVNLY